MKILISIILTFVWSSTAIGYNSTDSNRELQTLSKADELLVSGELGTSSELLRGLVSVFEQDPLMRGLVKMAIIYLELEKPQKARVYISEMQVKLLGRNLTPHYAIKLAASYLRAGRLKEASSTLDQLIPNTPLYHEHVAEDVKMIQAFIDLEQINKATRAMILLDRKIKALDHQQQIKQTASAATN